MNRGSCFALPLGQRPKDTARTERKPDHKFEKQQTRTEYKYINYGGANAAGRPRPPPWLRARRVGPPQRGHHNDACTRGVPQGVALLLGPRPDARQPRLEPLLNNPVPTCGNTCFQPALATHSPTASTHARGTSRKREHAAVEQIKICKNAVMEVHFLQKCPCDKTGAARNGIY